MIRRTSGHSGVVLPRDHRAHRRSYINKSEQECRAQRPPTQGHVTTTASCRSCNWPVVRASVGVSEVVRTRPSNNHVEILFCRQTPKNTPDPVWEPPDKGLQCYFPFFFLGRVNPYQKSAILL